MAAIPPHARPNAAQRGAALVVGLIFLVLLTILGLSAFGISALEERMAGNTRDRSLAFQAAEAALRHCEEGVDDLTLPTPRQQDPARWDPGHAVWSDAAAHDYPTALPGLPVAPRCIIEEIEPITDCAGDESLAAQKTSSSGYLYRITARARGASPNTIVMLQTVFRDCE